MKHSRYKVFQLIKDRLTYGRDVTWTLRGMSAPEWVAQNWAGSATVIAVRCKGSRDGKPTDETRYYVTSLRTSAKALLQHVRDRYREVNGIQIMATLRSLAMNALRLDGFLSITEGLAALAHDIRGLLALRDWREPAQPLSSA